MPSDLRKSDWGTLSVVSWHCNFSMQRLKNGWTRIVEQLWSGLTAFILEAKNANTCGGTTGQFVANLASKQPISWLCVAQKKSHCMMHSHKMLDKRKQHSPTKIQHMEQSFSNDSIWHKLQSNSANERFQTLELVPADFEDSGQRVLSHHTHSWVSSENKFEARPLIFLAEITCIMLWRSFLFGEKRMNLGFAMQKGKWHFDSMLFVIISLDPSHHLKSFVMDKWFPFWCLKCFHLATCRALRIKKSCKFMNFLENPVEILAEGGQARLSCIWP